jgi:hypothetical protein
MSKALDYPPPEPDQSVALTRDLPKVSALLYDRVWNHIRWPEVEGEQLLPKDVGTNFGDADAGLRDWAMVGQLATSSDGGFTPPAPGPLREAMLVDAPDADSKTRAQARLLRPLVARINRLSRRENEPGIVPVYSSLAARDREYKAGEYGVLATTLTGLQVVDEDQLTWEQVLEFRKDPDNREKYIRLRHWFDASMVGKPPAFIDDAVRIKVKDYESAIKKHGLRTVLGGIDDFLDSKVLMAAIATSGAATVLPALLEAGSIVSGLLLAAGLAVKIGKRKIDAEDIKAGPNCEIAFVHEVKKLRAGSEA